MTPVVKKKIATESEMMEYDDKPEIKPAIKRTGNGTTIKGNLPIAHGGIGDTDVAGVAKPATRILENIKNNINNSDEFKLATKSGSVKQTLQGSRLPSGYTVTQTVIDNHTGKKADLADDIVKLVDEGNHSIKEAADLTGMSQQYAGDLYHKAGGKKKFKQGRRKS